MNILEEAEAFVTDLLTRLIPPAYHFHNLAHTLNVVKGTSILCKKEKVSTDDRQIILLAAWFHDTGYIDTYIGHEDKSIAIATRFLSEYGFTDSDIKTVNHCIASTKTSFRPENSLQKILCDADSFHLSQPDYWINNVRLKTELENIQQTTFKKENWLIKNLAFLNQHTYFTYYGKHVLEVKKQMHIKENEIRLRLLRGPDR